MQDNVIEVTMQFADSTIPEMREKYGYPYIPYGDRNDYPDYILGLYNKSAKHAAIINGKVVYIIGNGLTTDSEQGQQFLKRANEKQSWDDLMKSAALDIENFGGCYLQVIPRLGGGYNYYHISFTKIRTNETNSMFYYKKKWENNLMSADKIYPAFTPGTKKPSIFFFKEYRCAKDPYPLPSWVAACNWVESDIEISKATLTNAKTGFSASKFINLYDGEPSEAKKKSIQRRFENAATGAEGKKLLIGFNNDPAKKPTVDDLGASDLTKEDFTQVDNLITNNIFSGHGITHPLLFGIQQEGKLGNATELKTAYDIFKNTYVTAKQKQLENLVKYFASVANIEAEFKLKDVEPVGMNLDPINFKEVLPKEWLLEKLGIDPTKYLPQGETQQQLGNASIASLTGRQRQALFTIGEKYKSGKYTKEQAVVLLKGYGFTEDDINLWLGPDNDPATLDGKFNEQGEEAIMLSLFEEFGDDINNYAVISTSQYSSDEDEDFKLQFAAVTEYSKMELQIMELLKKQPDLTNEAIAEALKIDKKIVEKIVNDFVESGVIVAVAKGGNTIRKVTERLPKQTLPEIKVVYTYEKRKDVAGPELLPTSRPFCKKMVQLSKTKVFSRQDIQSISERLGYSVFKRAGGFWNNNGTIEYQCRHGWFKHVVIKKK